MTFGKDSENNGVLTLTPEETARFVNGEIITKHSGDSKGEFTITVALTRKDTPHPKEDRISRILAGEGEAAYKGHVITRNLCGIQGYIVDHRLSPVHDTVAEALHAIDRL